jgi:hypothetical protein
MNPSKFQHILLYHIYMSRFNSVVKLTDERGEGQSTILLMGPKGGGGRVALLLL